MLAQIEQLPQSMTPNQKKVVNGLVFQINWFACIFANTTVLLASTIFLLLFHFALIDRNAKQWLILFFIAIIGYAADSALAASGMIMFSPSANLVLNGINIAVAPLWLFCLWLSFSSCLHYAFSFLYQRLLLTLLICLSVIPFNYYIGANFRNAVFAEPSWLGLALIAAYWALLLPIAIRMSNQVK
ncbi:MAG: DUF2878 domain-containing protein [Pseudomonadales bacterium]|nr:DUF2878 domain-containing protein [Pseudomonadales bacterium]